MNSTDIVILNIWINPLSPSVHITGISLYFIIFLLLIIFFIFLKNKRLKTKSCTIELNIANQKFTYVLERDYSNITIAYKIYIELITRKAAIEFDDENDIVMDIYDSWYTLFDIVRNEIKSINGNTLITEKNSQPLIELSVSILNKSLRPHLTKHQSRFRSWYEKNESQEDPQAIQKKYPDYTNLVFDLKNVNKVLIEYSSELKRFIYDN